MQAEDTAGRIEGLVGVLRKNGTLKSAAVEGAFRSVPRHLFLPGQPLDEVYQDRVIITKKSGEGVPTSSSSQPSIMAIMLEQLDLRPGMRVLEIGAGTGYNAALMACLVGESGSVTAVDIQPDLVERAREHLARAGYARVQVVEADGGAGYPPGAPYDRIILTASSWTITPAWREQLKQGGRLVLPLALNGPWAMKSTAFERRGEELVSLSLSDCGFMPLQGAFAGPAPVTLAAGPGKGLAVTSQLPLPVDGPAFSAMLAAPGPSIPSGVSARLWDFLPGFHTWLALRSPEGVGVLSGEGPAAEAIAGLALIAVQAQEKHVETLFKVLPESGALLSRPPGAQITWWDPGRPDEERAPDMPFEVHVRQLGPDPAAARYLAGMLRAWDAAGRPGTSRLRLRAVPAGGPEPAGLPEGAVLVERPWTNLIAWYEA